MPIGYANWHSQLAMPIGLTIWEDILFDHMEQQVKERKKYSKLDEEAWQQVRIFVNNYFLQREEAVKARMDTFYFEEYLVDQKNPTINNLRFNDTIFFKQKIFKK
jgi:hypothetical protein